jgi:hypothetical protein
MTKRFVILASALTLCTAATLVAAAQQPRIINGKLSTQPAGSGLQQTFRSLVSAQSDVAWIGYTVPVADRSRSMCCWSFGDGTYVTGSMSSNSAPCCGSCRIEPREGSTATAPPGRTANTPAGPVKLEGSENMVILFRVVDRQVERVRTFSEDCEIDAGGRQVTWISDVRPTDSIALLESLIGTQATPKSRVSNAALSAIGMHADPSAAPALIRFARDHASTSVRSEALFWVAQLAGAKAVGTISEAIEKDPDTDVKKRAVFALSQLPRDEGIPLLIDVAKKNQNPAVRKQAMFWLGQSKDPRALEFFAAILK